VSLFLHKTAASQLGEPKVWVKNLPISAASVPASTAGWGRRGVAAFTEVGGLSKV